MNIRRLLFWVVVASGCILLGTILDACYQHTEQWFAECKAAGHAEWECEAINHGGKL